MLFILSIILLILIIGLYAFLHQPSFGKSPAGNRLHRIQQSPHFRDGQFQNLHPTPNLTEGVSGRQILAELLFHRNKKRRPHQALPAEKTNLLSLQPDRNLLVWFGHSSYFLQIDGKKILVDPVLSGSASPIRALNRSFPGTDRYSTEDLPDIDYLFISHDHWDHLDFATVKKLRPRVGKVITGLGTGTHLEFWGFDPSRIIEKDWKEQVVLDDGFMVKVLPARHFSGRGLQRNGTLWVSFALKTPTKNLYLGGDSGYDSHFKEIGQQYGPFDLALLECGQYNAKWKYIHMLPEENVQAAIELRARRLQPVHWGKFALANHDWDEPLRRVTQAAQQAELPLVTPLIGEVVNLDDTGPFITKWSEISA